MKSFLLALLMIFSLGLVPVSAEVVSRIAAVVNNDIITTHQLDKALQQQLATQEQQPSPVQLGALRQELLSRLIEETLVQQRIRALNLTVTEDEIETALLDVQKKNQLTREDLEQAVLMQGMEFSDYRANLSKQILRYKLVGKEVRSQVDVSEREVVEYYRAHLDEYREAPEIRLSAMTFPVSEKASNQEIEKIHSIAQEALLRLRQDEALAQVAASYNESYGATSSELGSFAYTELTPAFVTALEEIEVGGYSSPVDTKGAVLVLRIDERLPGGVRQFDTMQHEIYQMIMDQKTDARINEWTKALKNRSFIDIRL